MNLMVGTHRYSSRKWDEGFNLKADYVCEKCKIKYVDQEIRKWKCPECGEWLQRSE